MEKTLAATVFLLRPRFFEADWPERGTVGSAVSSYVFDHNMLEFGHAGLDGSWGGGPEPPILAFRGFGTAGRTADVAETWPGEAARPRRKGKDGERRRKRRKEKEKAEAT